MTHAAESTHWYAPDGSPAYEVTGKNGKVRPATLRDARTMNLRPSVTTIIRCAAAEGLERWKREQVLLSAMTLPRLPEQSEQAWMDAVQRDAQEQGKKAAERGTAVHAAIQGFYEGSPPHPDYKAHISGTFDAVAEWSKLVMPEHWDTERSFSHPDGFGGKVDLSCAGAVLDFKTTEKPLDDLKTWDSHWMQLSAYREGLGMPQARCAIVYVSVTELGKARVIELSAEELSKGYLMFKGLLDFWYARTGLNRG